MKILITGVAGFLGSHLADRLLNDGHEIVGVDNLIGGRMENVNDKVTFYNLDCDNLKEMTKICKGCQIVFHAACTAHDGLSVFSPYFISKNTYQITVSTLTAAIRNNVKRFVYCSSMSRYGEQEIYPFTEDMICKPLVPYAVCKYASELVIQQLCSINHIEYVIVVPHNIIGERQIYDDPYRNVASIMINRILQGKQPVIYGDGLQKRCFSYIDDVINCLRKILFQDNVRGEIINVGPDEEFVSINFLAERIAKIMNVDLAPIYVKERPQEVKMAYCSSDKARRLLDYKTKTTLEEALKKMVDFIKSEGPRPFNYRYDVEIINSKTPLTWKDKLI